MAVPDRHSAVNPLLADMVVFMQSLRPLACVSGIHTHAQYTVPLTGFGHPAYACQRKGPSVEVDWLSQQHQCVRGLGRGMGR